VTRARTAVVVATTTTTARPRPTTTVPPPPPPPPTTATTAAPAHSQTGEASWYRGPDGECAHNTAPIGSTIRVTNLGNGKSTTCRVAGRGPYGAGRVVDLTESTFARVASLDAGVFHARVDW
jgi:rare lipoprotein A (peptidoglycan hydrolase)